MQLPLQPLVQELDAQSDDCTALKRKGVADKAITPKIGKLLLAAFLKNSLLVWISLLLFSIIYFAKLYPIRRIGFIDLILRYKNKATSLCTNEITVKTIYGFVENIYVSKFALLTILAPIR